MTKWDAVVEVVRSFNDKGKPNHALLALVAILVVLLLIAAFASTGLWHVLDTARSSISAAHSQPPLRGSIAPSESF